MASTSTLVAWPQGHVRWFAVLPVVSVCAMWLREAAWFQTFALSEALLIVTFVLGAGLVVWMLAVAALAKVSRNSVVLFCGCLLAVAVMYAAREAVQQLIEEGYDQQIGAYTGLLPLVASKRGLPFVLALGFVPLLLAIFTVLRHSTHRAGSAASVAVATGILVASIYVAAT